MKKKILVIAAVLLAIGLTACGNNDSQTVSDTTQIIQSEGSQETETIDNTETEAQQVVTREDPLLPVVFIVGAIILGLVINMISGSMNKEDFGGAGWSSSFR